MEYFISNLHLVIKPCTSWAIHVDPKYKFIAIVHIEMFNFNLHIDKAVLLTSSDSAVKVSYILDNKVVNIPSFSYNINTISDLTHTVFCLDNVKPCINATSNNACVKYTTENNDMCSVCKSLDTEQNYDNINYISNNKKKFELDYRETHTTVKYNEDDDMEDVGYGSGNILGVNHNRFACDICHKRSKCISSLKRHMLTHADDKPNLCNVCGKTFCRGYRIEDHLHTHSPEKAFECGVCDKSFAKSYNLKLHEKTHTGERPYICSACGKSYTTGSNLSTHIKSVHNNQKPHACGACDMSFVYPRQLRIHMRKHTGEKPYRCIVCAKTFAKKVHLTIHNRTHTGEKPHICDICQKGFTTTGNLNIHKRAHHKSVTTCLQ